MPREKYKGRSDQSHTFWEIKKWLMQKALSEMGLKDGIGFIKGGRALGKVFYVKDNVG